MLNALLQWLCHLTGGHTYKLVRGTPTCVYCPARLVVRSY